MLTYLRPHEECWRPFPGVNNDAVEVRGPRPGHGPRCRGSLPPGRGPASSLSTWPFTDMASPRRVVSGIWPERAVSLATVHSTSSDARRALGRGADGTPHLPRGVTLRLGDTVTTDVERFASLATVDRPPPARSGHAADPGSLVRGILRTDWAVFDGTQADSRRWSCEGPDRRASGLWRSATPRRPRDGPSGPAGEPL